MRHGLLGSSGARSAKGRPWISSRAVASRWRTNQSVTNQSVELIVTHTTVEKIQSQSWELWTAGEEGYAEVARCESL
jgi:hypothetical protein